MPQVLLPNTSKFKPNNGNHNMMITSDICPLLTLTSRKERRHFPFTVYRIFNPSIWWGPWKSVPSVTKLFMLQNSTSLSPLSFIVLHPCVPIAQSLLVFSDLTLAFKSPAIMITSCLGVSATLEDLIEGVFFFVITIIGWRITLDWGITFWLTVTAFVRTIQFLLSYVVELLLL